MPLPNFETYNEILEGMIGKVVTNSQLSDVSNSSALMTILAAAARSDSKIAYEALKILQLFDLDNCTGDDLERRAAEIFPVSVGGALERQPATNATGSVVFSRIITGVAIDIPRGVTLKTASNIQFRTTDVGRIEAADTQSQPVKVVALEPGQEGNVSAGTITQFANKPQGVDAVLNESPVRFGEDRESDDSFRARIKLWLQSLDHCTVRAIESIVLGVKDPLTDSMVRFAKVVEPVDNPGYAKCFIDDGTGQLNIGNRVEVENEQVTDYPGNTSGGIAQGGEANLFLRNKPVANIEEVVSTIRGPLARGVPGYLVNPSNGQLQFDPPLVAGERIFASYTYYDGLIAEVQKVIDGDENDRLNYPGYRAAGCNVQVLAPFTQIINVEAQVMVETGYDRDLCKLQAKDAISQYINTLGIGRDVVYHEVVAQIMEVEGIVDVRPLTLNGSTSNILTVEDQLPRTGNVEVAS